MIQGITKEPETEFSGKQVVYCLYDEIPSELSVDSDVVHKKWTFLASIHARRNETVQSFNKG